MKKFILSKLFLWVFFITLTAQSFNVTQVGRLEYDSMSLNDVWGWVAPDSTEYALVGTNEGLSIVSLADPANPVEVQFVEDVNSAWRDVKTYNNLAYVMDENWSDTTGMLIVDLSYLPDSLSYFHWQTEIEELGVYTASANLFIDENGFMYLAQNSISDNVLLFDLNLDPFNPTFLSEFGAEVTHNIYVQNNIAVLCDIDWGGIIIYDVSDKLNPVLLGSLSSPEHYPVGAWLSNDQNIAFATDDGLNAPLTSYDVSDPNNITKLDEFRPNRYGFDLWKPHNVVQKDDWLFIAAQEMGLAIVDASEPNHLIEVAFHDTGDDWGFSPNGAWDVYPFLPSGNILVSDIETGLYLFEPELNRAARIKGTVTISNGILLPNAKIEILSNQDLKTYSNGDGSFKLGTIDAGTQNVKISKEGYKVKIIPIDFVVGETVNLDVTLQRSPFTEVSGYVRNEENGTPIANAKVYFTSETENFSATTDSIGFYTTIGRIGVFNAFAGKWGYRNVGFDSLNLTEGITIDFELKVGYQDDFMLDLGWEITNVNAGNAGFWDRGEPIGAVYHENLAAPEFDTEDDIGNYCYVTEIYEGYVAYQELDQARTILTSPDMNLTNYINPTISYNTWFFNDGPNNFSTPDDTMAIYIENGLETVLVELITYSQSEWRPRFEFNPADFLEITENMNLIVEVFESNTPSILEAGFDAFKVDGEIISDAVEPEKRPQLFSIYPNPSKSKFRLDYEVPSNYRNGVVEIYSTVGQLIQQISLLDNDGSLDFGTSFMPGIYLVHLKIDGKIVESQKMVKVD